MRYPAEFLRLAHRMKACLLFYLLRNLKLFTFADAWSKGDRDLRNCFGYFGYLRSMAVIKCILVSFGLYCFTLQFVCPFGCTFHSLCLFILSKLKLFFLVLGYHPPLARIHLQGQLHLKFELCYYPLHFQRCHRNFQLEKVRLGTTYLLPFS